MQQITAIEISSHIRRNKRHRFFRKLVQLLCCFVIFCTTYALILPAITLEQQAFCGLDEHLHGTGCSPGELICSNTDSIHKHTTECYDCVLLEHSHTLICWSDPEADIESPDVWESSVSGVQLNGTPAENLAAIAQSQLGYTESSRNYVVDENQVLRGYTRYGAWYGTPYEDWSGLFAIFCLRYAGISHVTGNPDVALWADTMIEEGLLRSPEKYIPQVGDLVFYDQNSDGRADHMGIVVQYHPAGEHTGDNITVIEGDSSNAVRSALRTPQSPMILGYGAIFPREIQEDVLSADPPAEPTEESMTDTSAEEKTQTTLVAQLFTDADYETVLQDPVLITLTGSFPEGAAARAYPVTVGTELDVLCAYDITVFLPDGTIYVPASEQEICVSIQNSQIESAQTELDVYYIPESGPPDPIDTEVSGDTVRFHTDHFSVYAVTRATNQYNVETSPYLNLSTSDDAYSASGYETFCVFKTTIYSGEYYDNLKVTITTSSSVDLSNAIVHAFRYDWNHDRILSTTNTANSISFYIQQWELRDCSFAVLLPPKSNIDSMVLTEDLVISSARFVTSNVTIDLNGHTIRPADDYGSDPLFEIISGKLTIMDSAAPAEMVLETTLEPLESHLPSIIDERNGITLNYYVTQSEIVNSATGATSESVWLHSVNTSGLIRGGSGPLIRLSGGSLELQSGMLVGGSGLAIDAGGNASIKLSGGYICNFQGGYGGAIALNGGTLDISGNAVIAGNHASTKGGGIYATGGAAITMTGGVLSGNTAADSGCSNGPSGSDSGLGTYGGGGIAISGANLTISGGYLTNNCSFATGYWSGGGAVYSEGEDSIHLSGGYITGNSANAGGGIKTRDYGGGTTSLNMSGGFVCSNLSTYAEGGGISVGAWDNGTITGGYINNNFADCHVDWGGGGLFVANEATMYMTNVLVTENDAGGFGGGVAGCSTAKILIAAENGGAIYGNSAIGANLSGGDSAKNEDWTYAKNSPVFMENGYADLYNALSGTVKGNMLGGGNANWSGSCDGFPVSTTREDDVIYSERVLGLTAHPDSDAITAAQFKARVFVNGNYAYTHGGGILCNGYLRISPTDGMAIDVRLYLTGTKQYRDDSNQDLPITENLFTFLVEEAFADGTRKTVSTVTCDENGVIQFLTPLTFTKASTYTYYIREEIGAIPGVVYDTTQYRLTVTTSVTQPEGSRDTHCAIDRLLVEKWDSARAVWITFITAFNPEESENRQISLSLGKQSFVNTGRTVPTETEVTVRGEWAEPEQGQSVTVTLLQNGKPWEEPVILSLENNWTYTWEKLPFADEAGNPCEYTVLESSPPEFDTVLETVTQDDGYSKLFIITHTQRTYTLTLTKISGHAIPIVLPGAGFRLLDETGQVLQFLEEPEGSYQLVKSGQNILKELFTDAQGKLTITNLPAGTYTLEETTVPTGYQPALPQTITLGGDGMLQNRTMDITVVDELVEYELPETGGIGIYPYYAGGLLMVIAVLTLLYDAKKRRKEDSFLS